MVTQSSCASDPHIKSNAWRRGFLLLLMLSAWATSARSADADATLSIGVRSFAAFPPAEPPGRIYAVLAVQNVQADTPLVKPVDEARLLYRLVAALNANGFKQAQGHQRPDILLTVAYGRGWLRNPYLTDSVSPIYDTNSTPVLQALNGSGATASRNIAGPAISSVDGQASGYEAELQKASYEKLYIRVTAFEYSSDPKARAHLLWNTTMVMDDPDHRDLNTLAPKMLTAGANYFGRAMTEKEVTFTVAAPTARVRVGTPEVVGVTAPVAGTAPKAPAAAPPPVPVLQVRFDLPAGEAVTTLQEFSRQSGEEIIYAADQIRMLRTQAVNGELSPRSALDRMLDKTGFFAEWDDRSGIFIIRRASR